MTATGSTGASDIAIAIAAHGLTSSEVGFPTEPLADEHWSRLLREVESQRIPGFLAAAISDGRFVATPAQERQIREQNVTSVSLVLLLEGMLIQVAGFLERSATPYRVLKGSAHARLDYPDPSLRSFGDVDLLVRSEDFDRVAADMQALGGTRRFPEPRPGFDRRFSKGASFLMPSGLELDLHRTFVSGPFGLTVDLAQLFSGAETFEVGSRRLPALAPEERFVHACFHAVLGSSTPRLLALRDVAQLIVHRVLDTQRVATIAGAWQCEIVVASAVNSAWRTFQLTDDGRLPQWAARFQPRRDQARRLSCYTGRRRSYAGQSMAAVWAIPTIRAKLAYVRALVSPRQTSSDDRHLARWHRGLRALARRVT